MPKSYPLKYVTVNLFGKRVFADPIKVRLSRWDHLRLGKAINPMRVSLYETKDSNTHRDTQRGRPCGHMGTQKKNLWRWRLRLEQWFNKPRHVSVSSFTRSWKEVWNRFFPQSLQKEPILPTLRILDFQLLTSRTLRE